MKYKVILLTILAFTCAACVSSRTVVEKQLGDDKLACAEIADRIAELNALKAVAEAESGVSGKNVAAGLLFWPAIIANQMKSGDNLETVNNRKSILVGYYEDRSCSNDIPTYSNEQIIEKMKNNEVKELNG